MDPAKNPFNPGAGVQPPELAGRDSILRSAELAIRRMKFGNFSRSSLLLGLRGVGKTVLLNRIAKQSSDNGCEVGFFEADIKTPLPYQLAIEVRSLLIKLDRRERMKEAVKKAAGVLRGFASAFSIKLGDFSIEVTPSPASGDLVTDLTELLTSLGKASKAVGTPSVLLIDELQSVDNNELSSLIVALHRISQLGLPFLLFGAGLPLLTRLATEARTYAERLFEFPSVGRLNNADARKALAVPVSKFGVEFADEAIELILSETEGYPYFLQVWGSHTWNHANSSPIAENDVINASKTAHAELDSGFYRMRLDRLTPRQTEYVQAMAGLAQEPVKSSSVAKAMGLTVTQAAQFRKDLIDMGIIYPPDRGLCSFTVPGFGTYLNRNHEAQ